MLQTSFSAVVRHGARFPSPTLPENTSEIPTQTDKFQPPRLLLLHHMPSQGSNKCLTLLGLGAFTAADTNRALCKWNTSSGIVSSLHAESQGPGSVTAGLGRLTARSVPPQPSRARLGGDLMLCSIAAKCIWQETTCKKLR